MSERAISWLLRRPSRVSWVLLEFLRPLPWWLRIRNAWWQLRYYGDCERFRDLIEENRVEFEQGRAGGGVTGERERNA